MRKISLFIAAICCAVTINATEGALSGKFSVAADKQVVFSQGNLQYQASTQIWRFAENQYDTIGADNANISSTNTGWIDLFGWGTGNNPTLATEDYDDYQTFTDWGTNPISNGGNAANAWRTLTTDEWAYIYRGRSNADNLWGLATVNGVRGFIFLPDNWTTPSGLSFTAKTKNWRSNQYSLDDWSQMETAGAVFLSAEGMREGTTIYSVGSSGLYWSSTPSNDYRYPYTFCFANYGINPQLASMNECYEGQSVRLVQVYKEPVEDVASYVCDFTKQASSTNQYYNTTWTYDTDWKIFGGSTYYADWDYCKFGGKYSILAEANPVYLANIAPFGNDVRRIKVYIHAGSLGNSEMSVNSWGVEAYSSDDYSEINRLGTVTGSAISNAADTIIIDIDDANSAWWNAGNYLRVFWDLANNSNTPGIIFVDKVEFYTIKDTATDIDNLPSDASNKSDSSTQKILRDGKIHILRGEKIYTLQGQEVK